MNIEKFAKKYQCNACDRMFNQTKNLNRHAKICCAEIEEIYVGGKFKPNETLFERLESWKIGINVPEKERYYRYVSAFDFESIQVPDDEVVHGRSMRTVHVPVTFSIYSNIDEHTEPVHVVSDGDPQKLVDRMIEIQLKQQEKASSLMHAKFHWVFKHLEEKNRRI